MDLTLMNNQIIETKDAKISATCFGFTLAGSVFEAIRVNWNSDEHYYYIPNLKRHLKRLYDSLKIMRMKLKCSELDIENSIVELIKKWDCQCDGYIRLTAYISTSSKSGSVYLPDEVESEIIISIRESKWEKAYTSDISCCVSSWTRINDNAIPPRVKSAANYENTRLAGQDARLNGFDNAILLNDHGKVSEAAESTIFLVDDDYKLITPTKHDDILESINRKTICDIWEIISGTPVIERNIDRTELYLAKEVFLCNTAKLLRKVVSIDHYNLSDSSEVILKICKDFEKAVRGESSLLDPVSLKIYPE